MRRVALFAVVAVLLGSAYPLLRGQEVREPTQRQPLPNPATSGAIVVEPPAGRTGPAWEYKVVYAPVTNTGTPDGPAKQLEVMLNETAAGGWEYVERIRDTDYLFKRPKPAAVKLPAP